MKCSWHRLQGLVQSSSLVCLIFGKYKILIRFTLVIEFEVEYEIFNRLILEANLIKQKLSNFVYVI
jgi:hypothetical protein